MDGLRLSRAITSGIRYLTSRQDYLNKINVFPVPDEWKYPTRGSAIEGILKKVCLIVQKYREQ